MQPSAPAQQGNVPTVAAGVPPLTPLPPAKSGNTLRNVLIAAAICLLLFIGVGIAGAIYAARVAKEKAASLLKQVAPATVSRTTPSPARTSTDPGSSLATGDSDAPLPPPAASQFSAWSATASPTPGNAGPAPLREGMLVVTAVADEGGDYESMKQINSIDTSGAMLSYHADKPKSNASDPPREASVTRKVLAEDMQHAHEYAEIFGNNDPPSFPGTTAISMSRDVFTDLQQKGTSQFSFRPDGLKGALGSLFGAFSSIAGMDSNDAGGVSLDKLQKEECKLQKEGNGLYAFPVLLDAQPTTLPAVRAACMTDDGLAEFYILNQADYPLMLSWKLGSGSQLQVIKITYPAKPQHKEAAPSAIEEELKEKKKVDIYGIYFDFASDHLKPESTPVLQEIAGVLTSNPSWKLTVNGHTDNVGGDVYNLDLSKRRAAAVKLALVSQYHIGPDRLSTDGFGASRPVDTNETLAGRARNRRVELTRQ